MSLPRVNVNVGEETITASNLEIPFIPAVLMKTKSGPIGTVETVSSESQFKAMFGESDYTTPSAYAIQTYLRSYSYIYITRLANENEAKLGTGKMTFTQDSDTVELMSATTKYKTDLFNGKEIKLVYDNTNHKIWIDVSSITGKNTISIKEDFTADTATAETLSTALDKIINSINVSNLGFTLTNLFVDKTSSDKVPSIDLFNAGFSLYIEEGDSGNSTLLDDSKVKEAIDLYDIPDRDIDVMVIPEYTNHTIVNYATELAEKNNFVFLVSAKGNTVDEVKTNITNYNTDNKGSLVIYYPDVYYNNFYDNEGNLQAIPLSVAVLHTYAKTDNLTKWGAPAGVTRGTLSLVNSLTVKLSEEMITELYDNTIPVNCINTISGKGFIVWGNKTTSGDSNFFDRINISRLVKYVTKQVALISWDYLFEPITLDVFTGWTSRVTTLLDNIKSSYGIAAYDVTMDDSINTPETIAANQLNGIIKIKPQEVAEFINIDFTITDTVAVSVEE
jgi:hypothetical protein